MISTSDLELAGLVASYRSGASLEAVAFQFNMSKTAVVRRLNAAGVPRRARGAPRGGRSQAKKAAVLELMARGKSKQEIAVLLHVCLRTIYRRLA